MIGTGMGGGALGAIVLAAVIATFAGMSGSARHARRGRFARAMLGLPAGFVIGYVAVSVTWMIFGTSRPRSSGGDAMATFFVMVPPGGFVMAIVSAIWLGRRRGAQPLRAS